jgi:DNA (cytosine-5)-methyltransferase 1
MPHALDLFCGAGGASMGLRRAGFDVTGIDIRQQPRYPFEFRQGDAMEVDLHGFDFIWASPPCQAYTPLRALQGGKSYPDLVAATRRRLIGAGVPYVIENVPGAPLGHYITLCGGMFGLRTYRHRRFETSFVMFQPHHPPHIAKTATKQRRVRWEAGCHVSVTGDVGSYMGALAMGIDWMTGAELSQAIPPAYAEFIGRAIMAIL